MLSQLLWILLGMIPWMVSAQEPSRYPAEKDFVAYLFTYFTGGSQEQEQIHFAVSPDGFRYFALNGNRPVISSEAISSTGGVRDPHILRAEDGQTFYMVATDMVCANGWDSNRAMVLLKSTDLIHWSHSVVNIQQRFSGHDDLMRVWAPQTIYDPQAGKYMIYWSMKHGENGADIIYYAYANEEFTDLETEPVQLFYPANGKSCIDGDIVLKDGIYHLFYKTEGHGNGIKVAKSRSLTSGVWEETEDYKQQTRDPVEGSCVFRLIGTDTYMLMYDVYHKKRYEFCRSDDLEHFTAIDDRITMDFHPRHGTVIPITKAELLRLTRHWGTPEEFPPLQANPIILGYFADPEILYSRKTGKYYLYPTSDGYTDWQGTSFKAFSSENLVDWRNEGVILDLLCDVSWAGANAWAPTILEKEIGNGRYRYYFYFTGAQKIGVAVSDDPAGPFVDSGRPLIDFKPEGIDRGQEIDPDVFHDPVSGKYYLYWGNGYLAVAELNEDLVSIDPRTIKVITPPKTFREAVEVFYRQRIYYFLWSENDTRSEDYRVRYAVADSPTGPLRVPEDNLILAKCPEKGIYGTGHNSVLRIPGTDEWYIVYHRFSVPTGIGMGRAAGYHREVCLDRLEFQEDGTLCAVVPTL